jgi:hypothetical protein
MKPRIRPPGTHRIAQWVGFLALVALLAMATLPFSNPHRDATAANALPNTFAGDTTWHG